MIEIKNLTKIYKSKKKSNHKALDNINLTLPNNGLVFVIGKSGSGKSTLLNLLGGLDSATEGSIVVDGNEITKYGESHLASYRNNHIGFIFQDYHLLDELTVYENIVLSLNLNRQEDKGEALQALEKVGLAGYENRYPSELSGGERQRVAIARAIVKKPYVILADEPTGNLDNVTATSIVELLKELSRDCLIVIVSHNTIDTYKYADRIIQLAGGRILSDETRNPTYAEDVSYADQVLYYPMDKTLTHEDIRVFNAKLEKQEIRQMVGRNDKYLPTTAADKKDERSIQIDRKSLSAKNIVKLCLTFLKSKLVRITASSFMIAVIMVILALSQTILLFDSGEVISNEMHKMNQSALFMEKFLDPEQRKSLEQDYYDEVTPSDIERFKEKGFTDGEIIEVLNYTVPLSNSSKFAGYDKPLFGNSPYLLETLGTMIVDEEELTEKFGQLEYVAKLEDFHPCGVLITDYVADCILAGSAINGNKSYEDILGPYFYSILNMNRGYINGIIKTDYKETYEDLFAEFKDGTLTLASSASDQRLIDFTSDIYTSLGFSYTLNPNFKADILEHDVYQSVWHYALTINGVPFNEGFTAPQNWRGSTYGYELQDNEVLMNVDKYNQFFGTSYTVNDLDKFVPHEITLDQYRFGDLERSNALLSEKIVIKGLTKSSSYTFYLSDKLYQQFKENLIFTKGLYLKNNGNIGDVIDVANELHYEQKLFIVEGIHTMTKAVDVFIPIFELVAIVLCAGIVFILISFSTKMIKDKIHEIGILKALGCKNNTIGVVFGLQLLLIAICTVLLSTVGYFFFIDLANDVLIESLKMLAPSHIVLDLDFLTFKMSIVYLNSLLVLALTLISFVIPMIKIYRIKPVQIIKAKE